MNKTRKDIMIKPEVKSFLKRYRAEFLITAFFVILFFNAAYSVLSNELISKFKEEDARNFYNIALFTLSFFILFIANISYPKIYKFKLLLSGYALTAFFINYIIIMNRLPYDLKVMGISFNFYDNAWMSAGHFALKFLIFMLILNMLFVVLVPATVTHETGKKAALYTLIANVIVYILVLALISGQYRGGRPDSFPTAFVTWFNTWHMSLNAARFFFTAIISPFTIEEEHNYGTILVRVSMIAVYCSFTSDQVWPVRFMLPVMAAMIIWGMLTHWLSCLHHKAHYDPLLKIYNRQYLDGIISGIADVQAGKELTVLMCDIDHFKSINDTYGHAGGDAVLYNTAQVIRETALPEGIVCRYGGEEIVILLRDKIDDEAEAKAEKIRKAVKASHVKYNGKNIRVTLSIGGASTEEGLKNLPEVIKKADENVYKAKKGGRDKVVF